MTGKCFIDTNVWIYFFSKDEPVKQKKSDDLINQTPKKVVSWQVVNELCDNLIRKQKRNESFIQIAIDFICGSCEVVDFNKPLLEAASALRERHSISFWDSLIVIAANISECETLYSEDMQNGQKFGQVTVRNIFAGD